LLREPLRTHDVEQMRPAFMRWIKVAIVWQGLVLGVCAVYLLAFGSSHGSGVAWVSPAVGATFGTALPLQFVVMAALRSARSG
jgi:membrane protein implicated in regulation of membrane protease activity